MRVYDDVYIPTGNPDTVHYPTPMYAPGELGAAYPYNRRVYQIAIIDPALDPKSATGPVTHDQPAFWKDKQNFIVTNDPKAALYGKGENEVAGVFRCEAAPGEVVHLLQVGYNIPVASDGQGAAGDNAVILPAAPGKTAQVTSSAAGTPPPSPSLGTIRGASVAGVINVDLNIASAY